MWLMIKGDLVCDFFHEEARLFLGPAMWAIANIHLINASTHLHALEAFRAARGAFVVNPATFSFRLHSIHGGVLAVVNCGKRGSMFIIYMFVHDDGTHFEEKTM